MEIPFSKKEIKIFVFTLSLIILYILYVFVAEPVYKEYINLNKQLQLKQIRLRKYSLLLRQKDAIEDQFKKYIQKFKIKQAAQGEMTSVLSEIERIGNNAGVYLSEVKPLKVKDKDFYKLIQVEINYQADKIALTKFIYELQNSPILLRVKRLVINYEGTGSKLLQGELQISKLSLY